MAKIKGCTKAECNANIKKVHYKKNDEFCTKCGMKLYFVCKKCHSPIEEKTKGNLCIRCKAEKEDKRDKRAKQAGQAVGGVAAVAVALGSIGKMVIDIAKNSKK